LSLCEQERVGERCSEWEGVDGHHGDGGRAGPKGAGHATLHTSFVRASTQMKCDVHKADGGLHGARTHWHTRWRTRTPIAPCDQSHTKLVTMCALLLHHVATQGSCNPACACGPTFDERTNFRAYGAVLDGALTALLIPSLSLQPPFCGWSPLSHRARGSRPTARLGKVDTLLRFIGVSCNLGAQRELPETVNRTPMT
jgi:hypothetical protein